MQSNPTASFPTLSARSGVYVADGFGVKVSVQRGHLHVCDGIGRQRRETVFPRAQAGIRRLVVLGHSGFVTLGALRWLGDLGIAFIHIDTDGRVLASQTPPGADDARLRRAQALAGTNGVGLDVARHLIHEKLIGQQRVLTGSARGQKATDDAVGEIEHCLGRLPDADSPQAVRSVEAAGANAYWAAWSGIAFPFARNDAGNVPGHWNAFGNRASPVTRQPRLAADPFNAILNYLYALVEAEARIACFVVGLDPGIGMLHADTVNRDSLALDIMEPVRPAVDDYVLGLARTRVFTRKDFHETRQGICRILAPLTHHLAETLPEWRRLIGPVAERVAAMLAKAPGSKIARLPTPLTQANRKAGRDGTRRRGASVRTVAPPRPPQACACCGATLPDPRRTTCDTCLPARQAQHVEEMLALSVAAKARARDQGTDPLQAAETKRRRSETMRERNRQIAIWEAEHASRPDLATFVEEILPGLQEVSLGQMMRETGLSSLYCSRIRSGVKVPHPMHWKALRAIALSEPE